MKATIPYVEQKFDEFNQLMFGGTLPRIPILLSNAKTFLGQCVYRTRRDRAGNVICYDFRLRISVRLDMPENEVEDTIIHEMIHYYIHYNQLKDNSAHGSLFRKMMDDINRRFHRNITIAHRSTKEQSEELVDTRQRYHVVAVVTFHDGKVGIKVLPRILQRIVNYYNQVSSVKEVLGVQLYMSNDIFFNRYPNSSALKVHYLDAETIHEHLRNAERMECDGKTIYRNK